MLLGPVALFARTEQAYSTYGRERAMAVTREEVDLMLRLDQLYRPGKEAKKFVWSEALEAVAKDGSFFDTYARSTPTSDFISTRSQPTTRWSACSGERDCSTSNW